MKLPIPTSLFVAGVLTTSLTCGLTPAVALDSPAENQPSATAQTPASEAAVDASVEAETRTEPESTKFANLPPDELARNMEALSEIIGPFGASLGQGVERIAESGDPQVPTAEELTLQAGEESLLEVAPPPEFTPLQETDQTGYGAMINYWKPAGILGVDVSSHQGDVDWGAAWGQGSRFAYTKATEALVYKNPYFGSQYAGSATAGMVRGAYHFAIPSVSSGAAQADYFLKNGGGWSADGKTLPPLLDVEYNPYPELGNSCYNMSPAQMVNWIRDFSDTMKQRTSRVPMIYTTTDWWNRCTGYSTAFADHPLHIAAYNTCCTGALPAGWRADSLWQYTHEGPIVGDWNRWNGTAASLDRFVRNSAVAAPVPVVLDKSLTGVNAGDFNRNGTDDLVSRRPDGTLWFHDGVGNGTFRAPVKIGSGWGIFNQLIGGQDFNNDGRPDLVARKTDGTLWLYAGTGTVSATDEGYKPGIKSGQGWNAFVLMISPGDFTGDGRPDIIATKPDGTLWLYHGTSTSPSIVANAVKIGTGGWNGFDIVTGAGDYTGDGRADLLARKPNGALWLYEGTGKINATSNGYLPGRSIATGWSGYADIIGASDFNEDGRTDLIGFKTDMSLWFFAGKPMIDNGYKPATRVSATGWQDYTTVLSPGDYNNNGTNDLIARKKDGTLWFFNGNGKGGYGSAVKIGTRGWNAFTQILAPGDFNKDGKPDLLARHTNGSLWFYAGTGTVNSTNEGYKPGRKIGTGGWQNFDQLMTPGDYTSDGKPDILGRKTDGTLWLWAGTGNPTTGEGYAKALKIGTSGWQNFDHVITPGDFNGDKRVDLIARKTDGTLWFYAGTGTASTTQEGYKPARKIGTSGWNTYTDIFGPGDITNDTKPDLLATHPNGSLWLYTGTAMPTNPGYTNPTSAGKL